MSARHKVNILTAGFASPNGRAFLMPLLLHRQALLNSGLQVHVTTTAAKAARDCDVLIVEGRVYSARWNRESDIVLEELSRLREKVRHLIYISIADSASWDHARALPIVSLYCKSQLLRDRNAYLKPLYGNRLYTDYYHETFDVTDHDPVYSEPAAEARYLEKLAVSWNSGLADYSWAGPFRMKLYQYLPLQSLLKFPNAFRAASTPRDKELSCRIGTQYARESVAYQRKRITEILSNRIDIGKLSRRVYLDELARSRVAISPFGLGEITLRDFEIFMNGALLLKPDMSGIETWPDFYRDGSTMIAHRWDLTDLEDKIELLLSRPAHTIEIAAEGQRIYREHLIGPAAGEMFASHVSQVIERCENARGDGLS
jgi:hypothetical protein